MKSMKKTTRIDCVPASNFVGTLAVNVDNTEMSDRAFKS